MCYPVTCATCNKTTWSGCGEHIDSVKQQVPAAQWCPGHEPEVGAESAAKSGLLAKLRGR